MSTPAYVMEQEEFRESETMRLLYLILAKLEVQDLKRQRQEQEDAMTHARIMKRLEEEIFKPQAG